MARTVVGLFESRNDAQGALNDLQSAGFSGNNVSYITNSSGGLAGMLTNAGIPQEDASIYANGVQQGGGLIVAQALQDADAEQVASILDRYNVVDISQRGQISQQTMTTRESFRSSGSSGATQTRNTNAYQGGDMVVPIVEEEIHVGKREVESGGVRVNVGVEEVPVNEQVTLREETVNVQRRQVNQPVDPSMIDQIAQTGTIEVREHDEQAVVSKEARVVEEVVINKEVEQRTETIQDSVRRTDVDIDQLGGQTRSSGVVETGRVSSSDVSTTSGSSMSGTDDAPQSEWSESSKVGTAGGTLAGAATGAAVGSVGGPVGTVIGGIAGAVTGGGVGAAGDAAGEASKDAATGEDDTATRR